MKERIFGNTKKGRIGRSVGAAALAGGLALGLSACGSESTNSVPTVKYDSHTGELIKPVVTRHDFTLEKSGENKIVVYANDRNSSRDELLMVGKVTIIDTIKNKGYDKNAYTHALKELSNDGCDITSQRVEDRQASHNGFKYSVIDIFVKDTSCLDESLAKNN
jgi:hypothetical protein